MPRGSDLLTSSASALGLAAGCALWLAAHITSPIPSRLSDLDARLSHATRILNARRGGQPVFESATALLLLQRPMLKLEAGGAEPMLRLEGVAVTPQGRSALLALGDKPARWLMLGESLQGVTLRRVEPDRVTVESLSGEHDLTLKGAQGASPAAPSFGGTALQAPPNPAPPPVSCTECVQRVLPSPPSPPARPSR